MKLFVAINQENVHLLADLERSGADGFFVNASASQEIVFRPIHKYLQANPKMLLVIEQNTPAIGIGTFSPLSKYLSTGEEFRFLRGPESISPDIYIPFLLHGAEYTPKVGDHLLEKGGLIFLVSTVYSKDEFTAVVLQGGRLESDSSLQIKQEPSLNDHIIDNPLETEPDFLVVPINTNTKNIKAAQQKPTRVLTKISSLTSQNHWDGALQNSHGIFFDRKEIAVQESVYQLGLWQKQLISTAHRAGKFTIISGGLLEHLPPNDKPYASDVLDITNAILDGVSAILLHSSSEHLVHTTRIARGIISEVKNK